MTFAECLIPKILVTLVSQGKSQQREGGHAPGYSKLLQTPSPPLPKPPIPSIGHGNFYTGLLNRLFTVPYFSVRS